MALVLSACSGVHRVSSFTDEDNGVVCYYYRGAMDCVWLDEPEPDDIYEMASAPSI